MRNIYKKGQAGLVMVLLIGLVAITSAIASSSLSSSNVQIEETIYSVEKAKYAAWAGVDELMLRLRTRQSFGASYTTTLDLGDGSTVSATITGNVNQKIIVATGYVGSVVRNLQVVVASSSSKASFIFAAQAGVGGFEIEKAVVTGANGTDGNVYSNGNVLGVSSSSGSNGSRILGGVWATGYIGGLSSPSSGGVYVKKNAWANSMTACNIGGTAKSPNPPTNCPHTGAYIISDPPPATSLLTVDVDYWKNKASSGTTWNGNCVLGGGASDCTLGTSNLGNIKILGNFTSSNGQTFKLTGPVWVTGNMSLSNNVIVNIDNALGTQAPVVVLSSTTSPATLGKLDMSNNVTFNKNSSGAGSIFISENTSINCASPAISMSNNAAGVVLISLSGCLSVQENATLNDAVAYKIHLYNNSQITYDPSLAKAIVDPGSGGWAVTSIKEY